MPKFDVDVEGKTYEVDAPDADTAWAWANQTHAQAKNEAWKERTAATATLGNASGLKKFVLGAGSRASEMAEGVRGLFSDTPRSAEKQSTINIGQQMRDLSTPAAAGGFATDVAGFALPGLGTAGAVTRGAAMLPRSIQLLGQLGGNAAVDAGLSAAYATGDRGQAAAEGAVGSLGGQVLGRTLSRLGGGLVTPSPQARQLMDMGVQPTIGQGADPSTFVGRGIRRSEEIAESIPLVGGIVTNARQRAGGEVAEAVGRRAVAPGGTTQEITREGIDKLYRQFDKPYSVLKQFDFTPDAQINSSITSIIADPNFRALPTTRQGVLDFINNNLASKLQNGKLSGAAFKDLDSEVGKRLRELAADTGAEARAERRMLTAIDQQLQAWRDRNLPADVVSELKDTDRAYAAWKRLARAGKYSPDGEITPAQLTRSVRAMSQGDDFARGRAFLQDITDPAAILRSRTPNSGTADRVAGMGLVAATVANPAAFLPYAAGAAGLGGAYTRPGQKFLLGGYDWQRGLQDALRRRNANFGDIGAAFTTD
jgi:hypothetical protein